ncbi:NAD(P)/FAD-dependent oxidoreductase [Acinetobacter baumannii]|uniref:NAD(P)/FAD-dependent oxidoreductase n=1 Tax=Acinetobacter baumannii TaxID=470 RepID=UPI0003557713|nr:FAD-dependent oxidoreductase [Acinetobacter baumannii]AGQ06156.1 Glycine/D-amino acid oxidases (deaminating) [Acinetobacter baumannii BJAB0715]AMN01107.1 D-amino-acid oxidase [Acinetobacter baumannii]KQE99840.1 D-amino acid oxidase [Acinetobacter baumannii]MBD0438035.1 FAD-binding oxidoreductase [Acinetobacter baumannii]MBP4976928.1 FAD-binding oxidoreductase [Acinetobacter baumannii]
MRTDAIVIGAGIVGAACAYELARQGLNVQVLDARIGGATAAGMGHLVIMDDLEAELKLSHWSVQLWHELGHELSEECAYRQTPTLWLASSPEEMQIAEEKYQRLTAQGVRCQLRNADEVHQLEPHLKQGLYGGLEVFDDGILYAPCAAEWLLKKFPHKVQVQQAKVIHIEENRVQLSDGTWLEAAHIVLANGIHATDFFPELPIEPKKGHLAITDRYPELNVKHTLVALAYAASTQATSGISVACNIQPRPTGQLFIGSSRQFNTVDPTVEPEVFTRVLKEAVDYFPALADLNVIRAWTGFRAATPDGIPVIGQHPAFQSVYLAVGHEGLGVTTATGTAKLIASHICGLTFDIDPEPFLPHRFIGAA